MALVLVLALATLAFGQAAKFSILHAPEYVALDKSVSSIKSSEIANVLTNIMGFESVRTQVEWTGVSNGNVFKRPTACMNIVLSGFSEELEVQSRATYGTDTAPVSDILLGGGHASVASLVSESTESFTLSMSSNAEFAAEGSPRDVGAGRDFTVSHNPLTGFSDASSTFTVVNTKFEELFTSNMFGSAVSYSAQETSFTVTFSDGAAVFPLSNTHFRAFFQEVHAMMSVLSDSVSRGPISPSVYTFAVASVGTLGTLTASQKRGLAVVLSAFVQKMSVTLNSAFNNNAVTSVVSTPSTVTPVTHHLTMRAAAAASNVTTCDPQAGATDYTPFCAVYAFYCNKDPNGQPFDLDTDCQVGCTAKSCPCAYNECACNTTLVQKGSARCKQCQTGFSLQGGSCYVDSNYPGMFQIWFWGGLGIALVLIATCYVIGGMDPGYDGIVYRMTSQRVKTN